MNLPDKNSILDELKAFSDIDYIVTDLDGTFVQHGEPVWDQLQDIQTKIQNSHLTITIATGRTYRGTEPIAASMHLKKNTPIILYNGAVIVSYITQNILYKKTIPNRVIFDLCQIIDLERQNILAYYLQPGNDHDVFESVHGFGAQTAVYDVNKAKIIWHEKPPANISFDWAADSYIEAMIWETSKEHVEESLFPQLMEPCSILIDQKIVSDKLDMLLQYLHSCSEVSCTNSGSGYIEVIANGANKGTIFSYLRGDDNTKKCVAIGDNDNDVDLLRCADIGVAVANASPAAVGAAKYLCQQQGTSGVLELLDIIKAANRYWERENS